MRPKEIDEKILLKLYREDLLSIVDCAKILKVSESCITRRLKKLKIIIRSPGEQLTHQDITNEQIIDLYWKQGLSISETAKIINKSEQFVRARLKKSGRGSRSLSEGIRKRYGTNDITDEKIIDLYENEKMSTYDISKYFNKSPAFARQRLLAIKHKMRKNVGEFNGSWKGGIADLRSCEETIFNDICGIPLSEHPTICDLYLNNKTQNCEMIAKQYNVKPVIIIRILKNNGIIVKNMGERNSSWKGGITPLHLQIRTCEKYELWRKACRKRDGYKCKISGETNNLQVHHCPLTFSEIFINFLRENSDLNPINDSDKLFELSQIHEPFWDINNGITVSKKVHEELHTTEATKEAVRVIQLYNNGVTIQELAKMYEVSDTTIRNILKENKIETIN